MNLILSYIALGVSLLSLAYAFWKTTPNVARFNERQECRDLCARMAAAHQRYADACSGAKTDLDTESKAFQYALGKHDAACLLRDAIAARK